MASIPRPNSKLAVWLPTYKSQIVAYGPATGLSAADIAAEKKRADGLSASIQNVDQKYKEWRAAAKANQDLKDKERQNIQKTIGRMQNSSGWTDDMGRAMGIAPTSLTPVNTDTYKPSIRAEYLAGQVEVRYTRRPMDGINVYARKRGESEWQFLGRATMSPYEDTRPVSTPGVIEVREYRAMGVLRDKEVGQPSDIVAVKVGE